MIYNGITIAQNILNKANSKNDFTVILKKNKGRYIVAQYNIYLGKNPSICSDLIIKISDTLEKNIYDSIGGWLDSEKGNYWLDANIHFDNLNDCISTAKSSGELAIYDTLENEVIYIN